MNDGSSQRWRWVDADGIEHTIGEWDLTSSLSSGSLPPYTLVWQPGWTEWLPACTVASLSFAIAPEKRETVVTPALAPGSDRPPPPPLEQYAARRRIEGAVRESAREPLPTLMEESTSATLTLRPPGAVPPPPPSVPQPWATPRPEAPSMEDIAGPAMVAPPRSSATAARTPLIESNANHTAYPPQPLAPTPARRPRSRRSVVVAALLVTAIGVGAVASFTSSATSPGTTKPVAPAEPRTAERSEPPRCRIAAPAQRVAQRIVGGVPPYVMEVPEQQRLAVGIAATPKSALGLLIDPQSLDVRTGHTSSRHDGILGVVPRVVEDRVEFHVDDRSAPLRFARTVPSGRPFLIGLGPQGFSRATPSKRRDLIWPMSDTTAVTEPRIAKVPGVGYAVAFRSGGQSGKIHTGWITDDGARKTRLAQIDSGARFVGTPMIAHNGSQIAVVFAARSEERAPWRLLVATAAHGELPESARPIAVPVAGPEVSAISPAAAGLEDRHWAIQWTEGMPGDYRVRLQVLDREIQPRGEALTLSADGTNAGQGVLWVGKGPGLSLFLVTDGDKLELWSTGLRCDLGG